MKIGVISDTHLASPSKNLSRLMEGIFKDVSIILHAGDLTRIGVLDAFSGKETIAVCGNMDHSDVTRRLPKKEIITIDAYRIGLIHGWGSPNKIEDRIINTFTNVQAIIYGHSHKAANHIRNGILMFNPGAFSGTFILGRNRSVGVMTIDDGIRGTIVNI
ncbi:YfcE family phosphodiesterase [Desulfobacteraceae bacterium SEEP-SAG9]|nr:YfcE family phosphodiesterase [Desulfobacteraceae bacterium SEEP-SAG9]